jgi:hypothetical protein
MKQFESWQDVNTALGRLARLEAAAKGLKDGIKDFAARHKRELEGKSMTLKNGLVGYRVEEKAVVPDEAEAIGILEGTVHANLIKVGVDKAALAHNENALALIPGASIKRTFVFVCKPNPLGKAAQRAGKKEAGG